MGLAAPVPKRSRRHPVLASAVRAAVAGAALENQLSLLMPPLADLSPYPLQAMALAALQTKSTVVELAALSATTQHWSTWLPAARCSHGNLRCLLENGTCRVPAPSCRSKVHSSHQSGSRWILRPKEEELPVLCCSKQKERVLPQPALQLPCIPAIPLCAAETVAPSPGGGPGSRWALRAPLGAGAAVSGRPAGCLS